MVVRVIGSFLLFFMLVHPAAAETGADKPAALQRAKQGFLENARHGKSGELLHAHPFFWAPFVLIQGAR